MANLYTYMITAMQQNKAKHHQAVVKKLVSIINNVEILQEDPIKEQFIPLKAEPEFRPEFESAVSDVS